MSQLRGAHPTRGPPPAYSTSFSPRIHQVPRPSAYTCEPYALSPAGPAMAQAASQALVGGCGTRRRAPAHTVRAVCSACCNQTTGSGAEDCSDGQQAVGEAEADGAPSPLSLHGCRVPVTPMKWSSAMGLSLPWLASPASCGLDRAQLARPIGGTAGGWRPGGA